VKLTRQDQSANRKRNRRRWAIFHREQLLRDRTTFDYAEGFWRRRFFRRLAFRENIVVPQITLALTTEVTEVRVELSPIELAQEQMKDEEKQRVLGFIPNFYVSYVPNAAPLNTRQKFELAWKSTLDPVTFESPGPLREFSRRTTSSARTDKGAGLRKTLWRVITRT